MPLGLLGKKLGSTRVYDSRGVVTPVTVVLAGPNRVLQVKTQAGKDGYNAVQLGFDDQKEQRLTKALAVPAGPATSRSPSARTPGAD